jgi:hypothetical protein
MQPTGRSAELDRRRIRVVELVEQCETARVCSCNERREQLRTRRQATIAQRDVAVAAQVASDAAWREWTRFCDRIRRRLASLFPNERQQVLQLVVERVIVRDGAVDIRHLIPLAQLPVAAGATASSAGSDAQGGIGSTTRGAIAFGSCWSCGRAGPRGSWPGGSRAAR